MSRKPKPKKVWHPSARIRAFLAAYRETASITRAAEAAKVSRFAHYRLLERSEDYAASFRAASVIAADALEDQAVERATVGTGHAVTYHGAPIMVPANPTRPKGRQIVLVSREPSDTLLLALLKAKKPHEYKDRVEHDLGKGAAAAAGRFSGTMQELLEMYREMVKA